MGKEKKKQKRKWKKEKKTKEEIPEKKKGRVENSNIAMNQNEKEYGEKNIGI